MLATWATYLEYHRSIYAQFRCGILPLHIETGRHANIKDPQTGNYRTLNVTECVCNIVVNQIT